MTSGLGLGEELPVVLDMPGCGERPIGAGAGSSAPRNGHRLMNSECPRVTGHPLVGGGHGGFGGRPGRRPAKPVAPPPDAVSTGDRSRSFIAELEPPRPGAAGPDDPGWEGGSLFITVDHRLMLGFSGVDTNYRLLQAQFAMGAEAHELQDMLIGFAIDQHQIGLDMAVSVILPIPG